MAATLKKIKISASVNYRQNPQVRADLRRPSKIQFENYKQGKKKIYPEGLEEKFNAHGIEVEKIKKMYKKRCELMETTEKRFPLNKKINPKVKKKINPRVKKVVARTAPTLELNENFFTTADAVYTSY